MRVLVTGGGGFVGIAISKALAARGDRVIAFDAHIPPGIEASVAGSGEIVFEQGDISDMSNVCKLFKKHKPDAVIHCAAVVGVIASMGSPANVFRVNIDGAINLFEAMNLYDVERVIHVSSEEIYGEFTADRVDESQPVEPLYAYGISKAAVEQLARTYRITHGLDCIHLRTSWVYGPDFPRMRVPRDLLEAAVTGKSLHLPTGSDSAIDHTYIDDFVAGALAALDARDLAFDAFHVASDSCPTIGEIAEIIKEIVPGADISVGPGSYKHAGTVDIPRKGALDCSRAREAFGYVPKFDIRAGLAAYAEHMKRQISKGAV